MLPNLKVFMGSGQVAVVRKTIQGNVLVLETIQIQVSVSWEKGREGRKERRGRMREKCVGRDNYVSCLVRLEIIRWP